MFNFHILLLCSFIVSDYMIHITINILVVPVYKCKKLSISFTDTDNYLDQL